MKLVWITNIPLSAVVERYGKGASCTGFWMDSLLQCLSDVPEIDEIHVICTMGRSVGSFTVNRTNYHTVYVPSRLSRLPFLGSFFEKRAIAGINELIADIAPDIVHIHGVEGVYGRIMRDGGCDAPVVVSIQGLLSVYKNHVYGGVSPLSMWRFMTWRDFVPNISIFFAKNRMERHLHDERSFLTTADGVLGRTHWDYAHAWALDSNVRYYHVDELMRPEYFEERWGARGESRAVIYTTARLSLLKGMHTLLYAIFVLKKTYSDILLRVAGSVGSGVEARYMSGIIRRLGLQSNVEFLGWLGPCDMIEQMKFADVFVSPSFIENSSNALCEAALIGMPIVATNVGGAATLFRDGESALLVRAGEPELMAKAIDELLSDSCLAARLGVSAREDALLRHDSGSIVKQLLSAYHDVIESRVI